MINKIIVIVIMMALHTNYDYAQTGTNDNTFNSSDIGFSNGNGTFSPIFCSVIQSDDKIIIGGDFIDYNGINQKSITRLNSNGTLDPTFNIGTGVNNDVYSIALQNDGKIIIGGLFTTYNGIIRNRIARLNTDGSLDLSFNPGLGANNNIETIAVQSDGKIIIGGKFTTYNGITRNKVTRLNTDGSLDTTFNLNTGPNSDVYSIAIQSDGKILVGGCFTTYNGTSRNFISRLYSDGSLDTTFNSGTGPSSCIQVITIQNNGKILIGGIFTSYNGIIRNRIARLNTDGSLDNTFDPGLGADDLVYAIKLQSDGKILIGGQFTHFNGTLKYRIARLYSSGSLESAFNSGTGPDYWVYNISLQSSGKIIAGGCFQLYEGTLRGSLTRLNTDGSLDFTFNPGTGASAIVRSLAIQSDSKIIIGGEFTSYNGVIKHYIARLNTNGSYDNTFTGIGTNGTVLAITIQNDGKIIIGGNFTSYNGTTINHIARINSNGSIDNTFNPGIGTNNNIYAIKVQNDGKIIIGGDFTSYNGAIRNRIARINSDGSLDSTFNLGTGVNNSINDIELQADGKIFICGKFTSYNSILINRIARLNTDGSIDTTFNTGTGVNNGSVKTMALQSNGKIIIGGVFTTYNDTIANNIARINSNGSLDSTFNSGTGLDLSLYAIEILSDGEIILGGGFDYYNGISRPRLAKLNSDGSFDYSFNYIPMGPNNGVFALAIQSDAKIIIGGQFTAYNSIGRNRVARILNCINTASSITASACNSYILNDSTYAESGDYTQVITNISGCDSIISLHLNINNNTGDTTALACDSFTWYGTTYYSSFSPTHVLLNSSGCDSIVTLNLTVTTAYTNNTTATICSGQSYSFNGHEYTVSGMYYDTLHTALGCDSVIITSLTVNPTYSANQYASICSGDSVFLGGAYQYVSGMFYDTLVSVYSCDSVIITTLTVNPVPATPVIILQSDSLISNAGSGNQWYNQNGLIAGATDSIFVVTDTSEGNYFVIVNIQGCLSDTSNILHVHLNPVNILFNSGRILISPNPATTAIYIRINNKISGEYTVTLYNMQGKSIQKTITSESETTLDISQLPQGIYTIRVLGNNIVRSERVVKK